MREAEMAEVAERFMRVVGSYREMPFLVVADLRGMAVTSPEAAAILGEAIEYARLRGVVRWVWMLDSALVRLQVRRIAEGAEHVFVDTWDGVGDPEPVLAAARSALETRTRYALEQAG